jgi:hypothetical protein
MTRIWVQDQRRQNGEWLLLLGAGSDLGEWLLKLVEWVAVIATFQYLSKASGIPEIGWLANAAAVGLILYLANKIMTPVFIRRPRLSVLYLLSDLVFMLLGFGLVAVMMVGVAGITSKLAEAYPLLG